MHYKIDDKIVIKSENAAKSHMQTNKYLIDFLKKHDPINYALDYGCGKGRYILTLLKLSKQLDAIDSKVQITRSQVIWGINTSLQDWAKKIQNLNIYSVEDFEWKNDKYDFVLNSNVLSAIPFVCERIKILQNIKNILTFNGRALITSQYRNSYFSSYSDKLNAHAFNDGWIIKSKGHYSFYGIIGKDSILEYSKQVGLTVEEIVSHDGSVFVIVRK